jgi:hypothetical protein
LRDLNAKGTSVGPASRRVVAEVLRVLEDLLGVVGQQFVAGERDAAEDS